jgi:hypothetical protein
MRVGLLVMCANCTGEDGAYVRGLRIMKVSYRRGVMGILAASAVLLAACGEPSKSEYMKDVRAELEPLSKQFDKIDSPDAKQLRAAGKAMQQAADDLGDVESPKEVAGLHERLVKDVDRLGGLVVKMAPIMEQITKDPNKAMAIQKEASATVTDVQKTIERLEKTTKEFEKKGYDMETLT